MIPRMMRIPKAFWTNGLLVTESPELELEEDVSGSGFVVLATFFCLTCLSYITCFFMYP